MNPSQFDAGDSAHDAEIQAQLCAYNAAFDELGLRFRWDAQTLALLAMIDGEQAQIAAYIEAHHAHLLKAYSAEFLSQAILEKKRARYPAPLPRRRRNRAAFGGGRTSLRDGQPARARFVRGGTAGAGGCVDVVDGMRAFPAGARPADHAENDSQRDRAGAFPPLAWFAGIEGALRRSAELGQFKERATSRCRRS